MVTAVNCLVLWLREKNEAKKHKKGAEVQLEQTHMKSYPLLPPNWYVFILLAMGAAVVYHYSLWVPVCLVYLVTLALNPVTDLRLLLALFTRAISGRFGDLPLRFNIAGLGLLLWGIFVRAPLECFFWNLDELLFPQYSNCKVEKPVFLLGQPRSGTTKLLDVINLDSESFFALTMSEIRFPFLTLQYAFDFISLFDKTMLDGALVKLAKMYGLDSPMPGGVPEREEMRRVSWNHPDEDELIFLWHGCCHLILTGLFPDPNLIHRLYRFSTLPEHSRQRFLQFHKKAVQKVLYRRGAGRTFIAKWVTCWHGQLEQAKIEFPDAKFVVIVRDHKGSLRSWMKLQSLMSLEFSRNNVMEIPEAKQAVIDANKEWFQKEIEFCENTPKNSLHVVRFDDFVQCIPEEINSIYGFLGKKIVKGSDFDHALLAEHKKQSAHKKTIVKARELYVSDEQIETEFPDLLSEIQFSKQKNTQ